MKYNPQSFGHGDNIESLGFIHVITGDAVFAYDNLQPASEHLPFTVMGRFADIVAAWKSLEEIVRRADIVLPGHDIRTMDVEFYHQMAQESD